MASDLKGDMMFQEEKIESALNEFISQIKGSEICQRYEECRQVVVADPELRAKVQRTREIRKILNGMNEYDRNGEYADRLESEHDDLCESTGVYEFTTAELEYCKLYQKVMSRIAECFDIEIDG